MTIKRFRAAPLPNPTPEYEAETQRQLIRTLEIYFNQLDNFLQVLSTPSAGTTANRPTLSLQVGQQYFDTTLGYPIWYDGTDWVDATGSTV